MPSTPINTAIAKLLRRADAQDSATLAETFVDVNDLFARLSSLDSQVVFGRRGTGKTHALKYLEETLRSQGETVVYLDLRLLGSSGGIYTDSGVSIAEAGTRLLLDVLQATYDTLVEQALGGSASESAEGAQLLTRLDRLGDALGEVEIVGETEERESTSSDASKGSNVGIEAPRLIAFARLHEAQRVAAEREVVMRGVARHRVHFGSVATALQRLVPSLAGGRLWLIMDEWSTVSMDLQPLLADLIRHCLLPIPGVTVKFAAIEKRTAFRLDRADGGYLGIELGADVAADINLDEFMVFTSAGDPATEFFAQLFQRHIFAAAGAVGDLELSSPDEFINRAFAGKNAFKELVRAAEGVPRDGINVLRKAALHAADSHITLQDVRDAARTWYVTDKQAALHTRVAENDLLHWIIDRVIGERKVRGFILPQAAESDYIDWLYDARLIHLIKRGIAAKDRAGVRFDAYVVDYGCYVDLLATRGAGPEGLLRVDDGGEMEVPDDNFEVIRGSILDLDDFAMRDAAGLPQREAPEVSVHGHAREDSIVVASPHAFEREQKELPADWCVLVEARDGVVVVPIGRRPMRIGSSSKDHIRIRANQVSPRHALLALADGRPTVTAERGGVYVNELRVSSKTIGHRDCFSVGEANLVIYAREETRPQNV
jgi:hypothetical protein